MKKTTIIIAVVAVLAVIILWGISVNNRLVTKDEGVQQAWAQVENVYKRRLDLVPQLVADNGDTSADGNDIVNSDEIVSGGDDLLN